MGLAVADPSHGSDAGFIRGPSWAHARYHRGLESDFCEQKIMGLAAGWSRSQP